MGKTKTQKNRWLVIILMALVGAVFFLSSNSNAATGINSQISFQGKVVLANGNNPPDGTYNMQFKIYQDGTSTGGGTLKWTESRLVSASQGVTLTAGTFQVNLGSITAFSGIDWNQDTLWLSMNIGGTASSPTWDGEMSPYIRFTSVPYALNAGMVGGVTASQLVQLTPSSQQTGSVNVSGNITSAATITGATVNATSALQTGGTTRITSTGVLQNVTADAGILTSGTLASARLSGSYTGITAVGTLTSLVVSGAISQSGYLVSDGGSDDLLVNGDFERNNTSGWTGITDIATGGYSGNYAAHITGPATLESTDYIPVDPTRDVLQLETYIKKSVAGTTPGTMYFGYKAYNASKTVITTAPCGTYCYFAASAQTVATDGNWHKYSATTTGEGTSYPNFPVGTKYVRVLGLINYTSSSDSETLIDHVSVKRINNGALFVGNNYNASNLLDQYQQTQLYTVTSGVLTVATQSGADMNLLNGGLQVGSTNVITSARVLQNVTANTSILTSGTLGVARGGTNATTIGSAGSIAYSNGTSYAFTGVGTASQCLLSGGTGVPTWGSCGSGGVTTVGTYSTTATDAKGATISGSSISFQSASATAPGMVDTGTQTFAGNKTFTGSNTFSGTTNQFQSAATTQTALQVAANSLTTGGGLSVSTTSAGITGGNLLEVTQNTTYGSTFSSSNKLLNVNRTVTGPEVPGGGAVVFDNAVFTDVGSPFSSSMNWSHTVGSGSNRVLLVTVHTTSGTPSVTYTVGATTQTMTQIASVSTFSARKVTQWILVAPTTGAGTVSVSAGTGFIWGESSSWSGVDQTTPYGTLASAYNASYTNSQTLSVSATAGQLVVDAFTVTDPNTYFYSVTPGVGQTSLSTSYMLSASYKTAASSMSWDWGGDASDSVMIAVPLNPAAGGPSGLIDGTLNGSVANIASSCLGCTEASSILNLQQANTVATGAVLSLQNSGLGADIQLSSGILRNASDSTTALRIQNSAGTETLFTTDTTNNRVVIGDATGTGANTTTLVLDTAASDPTGVTGAMYYNTTSNVFRCYASGAWANCSGVTSVGTYSTSATAANGATVSGTSISFQSASASAPGMVDTGTQTFAGNKTFNGSITSGSTIQSATVNATTALQTASVTRIDSAGAGTLTSLSVSGQLQAVTTGQGTNISLRATNSAGNFAALGANMGAGNYNPAVQAGDNALIYSTGTTGNGVLTIAPWSSSSNGSIRLNGTAGTISINGATTVNAVLTSTVATGTAPLSIASTTMVNNLNVQYLNGYSEIQLAENLRSNVNLTGGGTVSFDGTNVKWTSRFIVIANGNGSNFSTSGYFDITMPTSGTITGVGGASNVTATASGVPLGGWTALYYILPIGSSATSLAANFRVSTYTSAVDIPSNWVLLALRNGDDSSVRFGTGVTLAANQYAIQNKEENPSFSGQVTSTVATGTAPLVVASTTKVTNLNADLLDGLDSTAFGDATAANQTTILTRIGTNADAAGTTTLFARLSSIDTSKVGTTADAASTSGSIFARLAYLINSIGSTSDAASSTGSVNAKLAYIISNSGGKSLKFAEFTTGTSWTAPAGVTTVQVFMVGGGGGGGSSGNLYNGGGGGGGGSIIKKYVTVTPGNSYTIVIGAGGTQGGAGGTTTATGGSGGNTTFAGLTAAGGNGGNDRAAGTPGKGGGGGGGGGLYQSSGTAIILVAGDGASGTDGFGGGGGGGSSGAAIRGNATDGGAVGDAAAASANTGGGGGGSSAWPGSGGYPAAGAGGSGYLLITWEQ